VYFIATAITLNYTANHETQTTEIMTFRRFFRSRTFRNGHIVKISPYLDFSFKIVHFYKVCPSAEVVVNWSIFGSKNRWSTFFWLKICMKLASMKRVYSIVRDKI